MSTTDIDLNALEQAALAATPGGWWSMRQDQPGVTYDAGVWANLGDNEATAVCLHVVTEQDEDFIAAANPAVVLELIRRLRAARTSAAESELRAKMLLDAKNDWAARARNFEAESAHWKANHDNQVQRARVLVERTDMPLERVQAYVRYSRIEKAAERYEKLRKFNPREFSDLWKKNLGGEGRFDDLVDAFDMERRDWAPSPPVQSELLPGVVCEVGKDCTLCGGTGVFEGRKCDGVPF